jgi:large subunit ribosomal protein L9
MKIILKEDVEHLGRTGDIVSVKPGYARNYLIPNGMALVADETSVRRIEHAKRVVERHRLKVLATGQSLRDRLVKERIVLRRRAGADGRLFGSVTAADVASALMLKGVEVNRRMINLSEPIKHLGDHDVEVKIRSVGTASLKVSVEPEEG